MANEEIMGGLISALSRGESLENAMMTFYNAGYKKEEIEDSAKEVYNQLGPQLMGIKSSLQQTLDEIASKAGVSTNKDKSDEKQGEQSKNMQDKLVLQTSGQKKPGEAIDQTKEEDKSKQNVSGYVSTAEKIYQNPNDISSKIEEAIKGLRPVNIPSRIEIVHKNVDGNPPTVVQNVSDYSKAGPKPVSKALTSVLIGILILLLLALGAVFLFKDELIDLFNKLGIA
jgi:hypothetical protein